MPLEDAQDCLRLVDMIEEKEFLEGEKIINKSYTDKRNTRKIMHTLQKDKFLIFTLFLESGTNFELHEKFIGKFLKTMMDVKNIDNYFFNFDKTLEKYQMEVKIKEDLMQKEEVKFKI